MRTILPEHSVNSKTAESKEPRTKEPAGWYSAGYLASVWARRPAKLLAIGVFVLVGVILIAAFASGSETTQWGAGAPNSFDGARLSNTQVSSVGTVGLSQSQSIKLGVYPQGWPGASGDPTSISQYISVAGKAPAIIFWFNNWDFTLLNATGTKYANTVASFGATPEFSWEPCASPHCSTSDTAYALRNIAAGQFDSYITTSAQQVKAWAKPVYIRLAYEMNGNWSSWGNGVNGNTPSDYIAMWRHIVTIFRQVGATNVSWIWAPNINQTGKLPFDQFYPGDSYVDLVGLDGYNPGTDCRPWLTVGGLFGTSYDDLGKLTSKPVMIAETASSEGPGGSKSTWITQSFLTDIPTRLPRVQIAQWFDRDDSGQGGCERNWRVDSSPAAASAWHQVVGAPLYSP